MRTGFYLGPWSSNAIAFNPRLAGSFSGWLATGSHTGIREHLHAAYTQGTQQYTAVTKDSLFLLKFIVSVTFNIYIQACV